MERELVSKSHVIASLITETRQLNSEALQAVLQGLGRDRQILAVHLVDAQRNVLGSYHSPKWNEPPAPDVLKNALDEAVHNRKSTENVIDSKGHATFSVPLPLPPSAKVARVIPGAIRLEYDFSSALSAARHATFVETLFDAVMFGLALLVMNALLFRLVEKPVRALAKTALAITNGSLSTRASEGIGCPS